MLSRSGLALAFLSICALALQVPAHAKPISRAHVQQQHKRVQQIRHSRHIAPPRIAPAPQRTPAQPTRSAFDTARRLWASARTQAVPSLVAEARKYIGTNPTARKRLWCATFMNFVLARLGYEGTNSDAAKSFAEYGRRISEPRVGAIAVLTRGRKGGHVGVVSGLDRNGNPIIISGNHTPRGVGEGVYARSRVIAYVVPTERQAVAESQPARPHAAPRAPVDSPFAALAEALSADQPRPQTVRRAAPPRAAPVVPHRTVQQTPDQRADGGLTNPVTELIESFDRRSERRHGVM
jgi:uncharacterized protein (TIGR02594 family)